MGGWLSNRECGGTSSGSCSSIVAAKKRRVGGWITQNVGAIPTHYAISYVSASYLEQEEIDDVVSALGMIEEDEKWPMDEPGSLLKGLQGIRHPA